MSTGYPHRLGRGGVNRLADVVGAGRAYQLEVWLINAEHLHNVPGHKTDVADSAWIAQMIEHGLVRPSFVPPPPIRELRDLTWHRRTLVEERTRVVQRLEKVMQDAGIKLTERGLGAVDKSRRAILEALLAGQDDPNALAELARGRLRAKVPALREALAGRFRVPITVCWSRRCWPVEAFVSDQRA